jgi:hypothetical protein
MSDKLTMADLLPSGDDLYRQALGSLYGDPAWQNDGVHSGQDPHCQDTQGLSKLDVLSRFEAKDFDWFNERAACINAKPYMLPASLRSLVLKDKNDASRGHRPIDSAAEVKRLVALSIRARIGDDIERLLHQGQLGGRAYEHIQLRCPRSGATAQDDVAWGIWQAIRAGYTHAVLLDLKDAFGNLPREAVVHQLQQVGLTRKAARWVWRLVRIDAVDVHSRSKRYWKRRRGIEQGNPLSPAIMNLGLAPVLHDLDQLNVKVFCYLDDIYIMARSSQAATAAFQRFSKTAKKLGFIGVRPLVEGEVEPGSKATRIIDTTTSTVPVLKTYEIDAKGISLADDKAKEAIGLARNETPGFHRFPGVGKLRKVSHCQALSTTAVRARNSKYLRPPRQRAGVDEVTHETSSIPTALGENRTVLLFEQDISGESYRDPIGERYAEGAQASSQMNSQDPAASPLDTCTLRSHRERGLDGIPGGLATGGTGYRAYASSPGTSTPSGEREIPYGDNEVVLTVNRISSRSDRDECIQDHKIKDSIISNRPNGRASNFPGSQGRSREVLLVSSLPEVLAAVHDNKPIKVGNLWKGQVLDFSGFEALVAELPKGTISLIVNTLLRAARLNRLVGIIITPTESWPWSTGLLGNVAPSHFTLQCEPVARPDGSRLLTLISSRPRRRHHVARPDGADLVFLRAGRPNRASRRCLVYYLDEEGRRRSARFTATSPAPPTAALEALLALARHWPGKVIAVPRRGTFLSMLDESPANARRALVIGKIRSRLRIEERPDHLLLFRSRHAEGDLEACPR